MADNDQSNPQAGPSSLDDKTAQRQVLGFLKEKLRLEGDNRDLLRDALREMRNSVRELERMTSRIETANRGTINLRDINREMVRINQANNLAVQKLTEISKQYGIDQNNQTEALKKYNEILEDKVKKEQEYNKQVQDQQALSDKISEQEKKTGQKLFEQAENKIKAIEAQADLQKKVQADYENDFKKQSQLEAERDKKISENLIEYSKKQTQLADLQKAQAEAKLERDRIDISISSNKAKLLTEYISLKNLEKKLDQAILDNNEQAYDDIMLKIDAKKQEINTSELLSVNLLDQIDKNKIIQNQIAQKIKDKQVDLDKTKQLGEAIKKNAEDEITNLQEAGNKRRDQLYDQIDQQKALSEVKLSADQELYIQNKKNLDLSQEAAAQAQEAVRIGTENLNEGELAYIGLQQQLKLYEEQKQSVEGKLAIEKEVAKNIGISGGFAKTLADKLKIGTEVYEAMTLKARELAERDMKRILLQEALNKAKKEGTKEQIEELQAALAAEGKQQNLISRRFSVLRAGTAESFKQLRTSMQDPVARLAAVGVVFSTIKMGLDKVGQGLSYAGNAMAGLSQHSSSIARNLVGGVTGLIEKIPLVGGLLSGLINGVAAFLDLLLGADDHIVKLGRSIGLSAGESRSLNNVFADINHRAEESVVLNQMNNEQMIESYVQLAKNLGINGNITVAMAQQNHILQKRLGLTEQETAELTKIGVINKNDAENQVKGIYANTQAYNKLTGVSLNYKEIVKSVTSLSGVLGLQFAKYPDKITKAVISTKLLGTELSKIDSVASQFLDFESSISKEFEAQLLTGRDINLNRARQLALEGKTADLAAEITKQLGDSESYLSMNRIQQEAIAAAIGMSREELGDMYKQQVLFSKLSVKDEDSYKRKIQQLREQGKSIKELSEEYNVAEGDFQKMFDQSTLESFDDLLLKIKASIVNFARETGFLEKFDKFLTFMSKSENIQPFLDKLKEGFARVSEIVLDIATTAVQGVKAIVSINPFADTSKFDAVIAKLEAAKIGVGASIRNVGKYDQKEVEAGLSEKSMKQEGGLLYKKTGVDEKGQDIWKEIQQKQNVEADKQRAIAQSMANAEEAKSDFEAKKMGTIIGGVIGAGIGLLGLGAGAVPGAAAGAYLGNRFTAMFVDEDEEKHAAGGIFSRSTTLIDPKTSIPHTFGEAGPEALIPLDQLGDMLSNTMTKIESSRISNQSPIIIQNKSNEKEKTINITLNSEVKTDVASIGKSTVKWSTQSTGERNTALFS